MPSESSRTNGCAGPQLELHLLQHVPERYHKNPLAAASTNQLRQDHPDLQRLAETDGVGQQDARSELVRIERLAHRGQLVGQRICQTLG
jgi:hypothetical protein